MHLYCWFLILFIIFPDGHTNFTKVSKRDIFSIRRKRYLIFPEGSHYMMGIEYEKHFIWEQPEDWNLVEELDATWELPSNTRLFERNHERDRRDIYQKIDESLTRMGYNGSACVKKIMCEAQMYFPFKGASLIKDVLYAVFGVQEIVCNSDPFIGCALSIMNYVLT